MVTRLQVKMQSTHEDAKRPSYATAGSAGADLALVLEDGKKAVKIKPGTRLECRTGVTINVPTNHVGLIKGRSGLAFNKGVLAFEGTLDPDFEGEVKVLLLNTSDKEVQLKAGDKIAQVVFMPFMRAMSHGSRGFKESTNPTQRRRGTGGFGSTDE